MTQWMQFIRMRPKVLMIGEDGAVALIREEEGVDTIKALEHVPSWL